MKHNINKILIFLSILLLISVCLASAMEDEHISYLNDALNGKTGVSEEILDKYRIKEKSLEGTNVSMPHDSGKELEKIRLLIAANPDTFYFRFYYANYFCKNIDLYGKDRAINIAIYAFEKAEELLEYTHIEPDIKEAFITKYMTLVYINIAKNKNITVESLLRHTNAIHKYGDIYFKLKKEYTNMLPATIELLYKIKQNTEAIKLSDYALSCPYLESQYKEYIKTLNTKYNSDRNNIILTAKKDIKKMKDANNVEGLIELSNHQDEYIKKNAILALGEINNEHAIERLIEALKDKYSIVRMSAALALSNVKEKNEVIEPLIAALQDKDMLVKAYSALALGEIGDKRATDSLIEALKDNEEIVRISAAGALGKIKDKKAVIPLIQSLEDKNEKVRGFAAGALGEIGDEKAVLPLIKTLDNDVAFVKKYAIRSLATIGDKRAVESLLNSIRDESSDVRIAVAYALGMMKDNRAIKFLFETLENKNEIIIIRNSAACSIEMIRKNDINNAEKSTEDFLNNKKYERLVCELALSIDYPDKSYKQTIESYKGDRLKEFVNEWVNNMIPVVKNRNAVFFLEKYEDIINSMKKSCDELVPGKMLNQNVVKQQSYGAKHILLKTIEEAQEVKKMINESNNFEDLAKKRSYDKYSAKNGGDLGKFYKDDFIKEFVEAVEKLKIGEVSDIVKTELGYHIILRTE